MVKWIKGKPYIYEQTSYREGGKVKTESRYIGAASADALAVRSSTRERVTSASDTPTPEALPVTPTPETTDAEPREREDAAVNLTNSAPVLTVRANLKKYGISQTALEREHAAALRRLSRLGVDPATVPPVTIKHGAGVGFRRRLFSRGYVVTLPRWQKGNRSALKAAFSKAVARASLDALKEHAPERFTSLAETFDDAFRDTTVNLTKYILATGNPLALGMVLQLRWFGNVMPVARNVEARSVGLVEYGRRKTWQDEAAAIMAEVQSKGFAAVHAECLAEHGKARAEETRAANEYRALSIFNPKRAKAKRRYRRAVARLEAQALMVRKLGMLESAFDLS